MNEYRYTTIKGLRYIVLGGSISVVVGFINSIFFNPNMPFQFPQIYFIFMIVGIILVIILLSGVYFIFKGKKEFTVSHEESVSFAGKLILYIIIFYVVVTFFASWIFYFAFGANIKILYDILRTVIQISIYLIPVYLIKELAEEHIKKLLWIGFYSMIIIGIFSIIIRITGETLSTSELEGLIMIISVIPNVIYLYCYYHTYKLLKEKYPVTSKI